jgi:GR25 family glycosyltransferase involved in LPS biosynthesis
MDADQFRRLEADFNAFLDRFSDCFSHKDARAHLGVYVRGQLSDLPEKSVEPIAFEAGVAPRTLQEFLTVHLGFAREDFHCLLDGELYLPESWNDDRERCREAGIPDSLVYRPKWQIALELFDRAVSNGLPFEWLTFDEGYGSKREVMRGLSSRKQMYVGEVPRSFAAWLDPPRVVTHPYRCNRKGRGPKVPHLASGSPPTRWVDEILNDKRLSDQPWKRFHVKDGEKRPSGDINEVFPHKACINLDRDFDSWVRLQAALTRHDIRGVHRVSAVDGCQLELPATWRHSAGAYGCLLSHLQVVRDARKRGLPSLLILEDDVVFDPAFSEKFPAFVRGLPADWDMVFLGALQREDPVPVAENVVRIRHAYSTYAYALRDSIFDAFIAANDGSPNQVDVNNGILQSNQNCYGFAPNLAWVESRYSPVQERMADHWYLRESVVPLGSQMDRILERTVVIIARRAPNGSATKGRNAGFLSRFYAEFLPGVKTCIVEQGNRSAPEPSDLPAGCSYLRVQDEGPFDRTRCFAAGLEHAPHDCAFLMLYDDYVFIDALSIRANLRICERYDCATGFKSCVKLTEADTESVRRNKFAKGIDLRTYGQTEEGPPFVRYGLFRRDTFRAQGGRLDIFLKGPISETKQDPRHRVFHSPNMMLRLYPG